MPTSRFKQESLGKVSFIYYFLITSFVYLLTSSSTSYIFSPINYECMLFRCIFDSRNNVLVLNHSECFLSCILILIPYMYIHRAIFCPLTI